MPGTDQKSRKKAMKQIVRNRCRKARLQSRRRRCLQSSVVTLQEGSNPTPMPGFVATIKRFHWFEMKKVGPSMGRWRWVQRVSGRGWRPTGGMARLGLGSFGLGAWHRATLGCCFPKMEWQRELHRVTSSENSCWRWSRKRKKKTDVAKAKSRRPVQVKTRTFWAPSQTLPNRPNLHPWDPSA